MDGGGDGGEEDQRGGAVPALFVVLRDQVVQMLVVVGHGVCKSNEEGEARLVEYWVVLGVKCYVVMLLDGENQEEDGSSYKHAPPFLSLNSQARTVCHWAPGGRPGAWSGLTRLLPPLLSPFLLNQPC